MEQGKCCETLSGLGSVALPPLAFATVFLNERLQTIRATAGPKVNYLHLSSRAWVNCLFLVSS